MIGLTAAPLFIQPMNKQAILFIKIKLSTERNGFFIDTHMNSVSKTKVILNILMIFLISLTVMSCDKQNNSSNDAQVSSQAEELSEEVKVKSVKEILNDLVAQNSLTSINTTYSYGDETYTTYFEYLYDRSMDTVTDGVIGFSADSGLADEISILCAKSEDDVSDLKQALEDRIEMRIRDFNGYKPAEVTKLGKAEVFVNGNYVFLIICDNADDIKNAVNTILN